MGIGIGPATRAPVRLVVSTISLADWSSGIIISVLGLMALAALTIIVERDQIGATNKELLAYVLSFPIYILSYVPISFQAIFAKAQWKPIAHKG